MASAGPCVPLVAQTIWNHAPVTVTGSVNVTESVSAVPTPLAPAAGDVAVTLGGVSSENEKT